ncbi:hypothetical protein CS542_05320 [Pedobacter sp. IW39]|nr:hypothetical protein CS542_05320 [Pedobacter sp. IW39]
MLQATFGYYQSTAAGAIVSGFLKNHPDYNPRLKAKILQQLILPVRNDYRHSKVNKTGYFKAKWIYE